MKKRTFTERRTGFAFAFLLGVACAGLLTCHATSPTHEGKPRDLRILQTWSGDYPVSQFNRLPEGQQISGTGYLGDAETFAAIWRAFKPGENLPDVDFKEHIVVFARNVEFYNRTNIFKVELRDGVAEIIAMETMSAIPIENKVAMALAVILREGVRFIQAGNEQVPVTNKESAVDPLNATYTIEDREFRLLDGRHEVEAAPGSATRIETSVFGDLVHGDLDGDGDDDAALLLVCAPGGSGTFYYVAAALNVNGGYQGTNAVLLGDRIAPQSILIRNGVIIANYADRRFEESMTAPPTVGVSKYMTLSARELQEIQPLGEGEQVVEGWVTIGHEVRSFVPCSAKTDLWLLGNSPALKEIMAAHHHTLPDRERYVPLFMVLAGRYANAPPDGFGAAYEAAFFATQLVRVSPKGNCKSQYILVDAPAPGALVASPIRVQGRARGMWFFEGDFPILLMDSKGNVIAKGFVTAKDEWMTKEFVPFEGVLEFKKPISGDEGTLIFEKDNPTGLPEHDDALEIPVFFE